MPYLYIYWLATGVIVNLTSGDPPLAEGQAVIARVEGDATTYGGIGDTIRFNGDGTYWIEDTSPFSMSPTPDEEA
jgi:hypothetical protein